MNTKHTAGNWIADKGEINCLIYSEETANNIACTYNGTVGQEQGQANAKLIAAAPELLQFCINTLYDLEQRNLIAGEQSESYFAAIEMAKRAIAKATE